MTATCETHGHLWGRQGTCIMCRALRPPRLLTDLERATLGRTTVPAALVDERDARNAALVDAYIAINKLTAGEGSRDHGCGFIAARETCLRIIEGMLK